MLPRERGQMDRTDHLDLLAHPLHLEYRPNLENLSSFLPKHSLGKCQISISVDGRRVTGADFYPEGPFDTHGDSSSCRSQSWVN